MKRIPEPTSRSEAARMLEVAQKAIQRMDLERAMRAAVGRTEPPNRSIVRFEGSFVDGGQTYSFVAIRADHYRGARRWFISRNDDMAHRVSPRTLRSPATWVEIVGFAVPGSIDIATEWHNLETGPSVPTMNDWAEARKRSAFMAGALDIDPTEGMSPGSYHVRDV